MYTKTVDKKNKVKGSNNNKKKKREDILGPSKSKDATKFLGTQIYHSSKIP